MKKHLQKNLTSETSHAEVVTLALYRLGGGERALDTEDIAVESHHIAPGRFSWKKYPDQINLELVRVFLSDAKKAQNRLVIGSGRTGWRLTQKGLRWAESATKFFGASDLSRTRAESRSGGIDEQRRHRERARLLRSHAWQLWKTGIRQIPATSANEVFRLDSYARGEIRAAKLTRLRAMFSDGDELTSFLDHLIDSLEGKGTNE